MTKTNFSTILIILLSSILAQAHDFSSCYTRLNGYFEKVNSSSKQTIIPKSQTDLHDQYLIELFQRYHDPNGHLRRDRLQKEAQYTSQSPYHSKINFSLDADIQALIDSETKIYPSWVGQAHSITRRRPDPICLMLTGREKKLCGEDYNNLMIYRERGPNHGRIRRITFHNRITRGFFKNLDLPGHKKPPPDDFYFTYVQGQCFIENIKGNASFNYRHCYRLQVKLEELEIGLKRQGLNSKKKEALVTEATKTKSAMDRGCQLYESYIDLDQRSTGTESQESSIQE